MRMFLTKTLFICFVFLSYNANGSNFCDPIYVDQNASIESCYNVPDSITSVAICNLPNAMFGVVDSSSTVCVTYTPNLDYTGVDTFCIELFFPSGASSLAIQPVCVVPSPSILGDFSVCPGETQTYLVENYNPLHTYSWNVGPNALVEDMDVNSITITWADQAGMFSSLQLIEEANATCSGSTITSIAIEENFSLSCNNGVNLSLDASCSATVVADMILEGQPYPDESYTIVLIDDEGNQLPDNTLNDSHINQIFEVQVIHDCSGNYCWGVLRVEDKIAPEIICPPNDTLTCDEYQAFIPVDPPLVGTGCSTETFTTTVEEIEQDCNSEFALLVNITHIATDGSGNSSDPCIYTLFVERESVDSIDLPLNYDGIGSNPDPLSCSAGFALDDNGYPSPSVTGQPGGVGACLNIDMTYEDTVLPVCNDNCNNSNSYKLIREWFIVEWCTSTVIRHTQIIKVMDFDPPVIQPINDITISTDVWGCGATIDLPDVQVSDNCSNAEDIIITYNSTAGVQSGNKFILADPAITAPGESIIITVTAEDCCGNASSTDFEVEVEDNIPPVVIGEKTRTVSLLPNGSAKVFAEDFDDGSHDGCGPIDFFVKRMDNGSPCPSYDEFPPAGNDNAQFNEAVFFCCSDVDAGPIMVQFRVCDDGDKDGIVGTSGDNCNLAMVEVIVQDKFAPAILCPPDITVTCNTVANEDLSNLNVLNQLFGEATAAGTCNVSINQTASDFENCGAGQIVRTFTATNAGGTNSCTQIVTIDPGPTGLLTCNRIQFADLNNFIYNWCAVNDNNNNSNDDLPALEIACDAGLEIPALDIDINGLCTEVGQQITIDTFNFAGGACKKYIVHYEVIDQCVFDENYVDPATSQIDPYNSGNGYFEFYIEIDAFDEEGPQLDCGERELVATNCDGYENDILPIGEDNCTDFEFWSISWRLDVDNNGTIDFPNTGFAQGVLNASQLGLSSIPVGTHRVLWLVGDGCGNETTCSQLITITSEEKAPTPYCFDGLSVAVMPSNGTVSLWANDFDAGSFDNCDGPLEFSMIPVQDVPGLTNEEAYAQSFTHPGVTQQPNGDYGFTFDCSYIPNGMTAIFEVYIFVTDDSGNWDFCTASLRIDDNFDACDDNGTGMLSFDGSITNKNQEFVELVNVELDANYPEFPMNMSTDKNGWYQFDQLFENVDYTLTPSRDDDHLNGVTTLDIVMIQKHVLGIDVIEDPLNLIAADVNNDCQVNGLDIVQLRKLILGKYSNHKLPSSESWRFVTNGFDFDQDAQPCVFDETANIVNAQGDITQDFTGVKIGDINGTAESNLNSLADTRTNGTLGFIIEEQLVSAGEEIVVDVLSKDFIDVHGFQFELAIPNAEILSVSEAGLNISSDNLGMNEAKKGLLRLSYHQFDGKTLIDQSTLFRLKLKIKESGRLSEMLSLKTNAIPAEAYIGQQLDVALPELAFRTDLEILNEETTFAVYQNEPNPFKESTSITFDMPRTAELSITVLDATGRVIYYRIDTYPKGENSIVLDRRDIISSGVLFYTFELDGEKVTKQMIVIE